MKFSSALFAAAAAATAALAVPAPQAQDGGNGIPPLATISSSSSVTTLVPASEPAAPAETPASGEPQTQPATTTGPNGRPDHKIPYATNNALFELSPKDDTWRSLPAAHALNGTTHFAVNHQDKAMATFTAPQTYIALEVWAYQRADGGVISVIIDGAAAGRIDLWNRTAGKDDAPVMLFQKDFERKTHVVEFRNVEDPRTKKFGQFNIDHVYITTEEDEEPGPNAPAPEPVPSPSPSPSSPAPSAPVPSAKPEQPPLTAAPETGQETTKPSAAGTLAAPTLLGAALLGIALLF